MEYFQCPIKLEIWLSHLKSKGKTLKMTIFHFLGENLETQMHFQTTFYIIIETNKVFLYSY